MLNHSCLIQCKSSIGVMMKMMKMMMIMIKYIYSLPAQQTFVCQQQQQYFSSSRRWAGVLIFWWYFIWAAVVAALMTFAKVYPLLCILVINLIWPIITFYFVGWPFFTFSHDVAALSFTMSWERSSIIVMKGAESEIRYSIEPECFQRWSPKCQKRTFQKIWLPKLSKLQGC